MPDCPCIANGLILLISCLSFAFLLCRRPSVSSVFDEVQKSKHRRDSLSLQRSEALSSRSSTGQGAAAHSALAALGGTAEIPEVCRNTSIMEI